MQHAEYNEQAKLFDWIRISAIRDKRLKWAFSSQAGERFKNALAGARAKRAGMTAGIPDVCIPYPNKGYAGLWIEMKKRIVRGESKPVVSPSQKECIEYLNSAGYKAVVCYGADEAIVVIKEYLGGTNESSVCSKSI